MRRRSPKRAAQERQRRKVIDGLYESAPFCARCGTGLRRDQVDGHELLSRARGGSITDEANIVLLCRTCHDDVTFRHHVIPDADRWIKSRFGAA